MGTIFEIVCVVCTHVAYLKARVILVSFILYLFEKDLIQCLSDFVHKLTLSLLFVAKVLIFGIYFLVYGKGGHKYRDFVQIMRVGSEGGYYVNSGLK